MENFKLEDFGNGIKIFQHDELYKFTQDAILLAKFLNIKHTDNVLELCAGSGVISFYAYSLCPFNFIYFNEIQQKMCKIIEKNIKFSNLGEKSKIFNCNLKNLKLSNFNKPVDVIICNPPYQKVNGKSLVNEKREIALARHEIEATLEDIVKKASELIKDKGRFYMVHLASRSAELIAICHKYKLEVKKIKYIFTNEKEAYLVLIEAVKNARPGVTVLKEEII